MAPRCEPRVKPSGKVAMVGDQNAEEMRVALAGDADDDVSGHAAPPALELTGTVTGDDDATGHLDLRQATSAVTLAASGAYMLIWQLAASGTAEHVTNLAKLPRLRIDRRMR